MRLLYICTCNFGSLVQSQCSWYYDWRFTLKIFGVTFMYMSGPSLLIVFFEDLQFNDKTEMYVYALSYYTIFVQQSVYCALSRVEWIFAFQRLSVEQFCSMLLLCTATMVWTSMLRLSFLNRCYKFALNSKSESARKDWEMHKRVELSQKKGVDI